ncbi:MAG: aminoacyl-tRNA hydrolase [Saprospiraceae bacterium]|nr:aminoacyl-tRNA hydrolase [Saprospiraceae bacterium]
MDTKTLHKELTFSTARSGGSGGQHVNKVETKVVLYFNVETSSFFSETQKSKIRSKLSNHINKEGVLVLSHDRKRSQVANKNAVIKKFDAMIEHALKKEKKRIKTKPSAASVAARKKEKSKRSEIKKMRKPPRLND